MVLETKVNYRPVSDIDITLLGANLSFDIQNKIAHDLDDSYLPYLFDISIFDKLYSLDLEEHIIRVGQMFYEKDI